MRTKGTYFRTIGKPFALLILATLATSIQTAGAVEINARQRAICTSDALKFCSSVLSDQVALAQCMLRAKPKLTGGCRSVVSTLQSRYAQSSN